MQNKPACHPNDAFTIDLTYYIALLKVTANCSGAALCNAHNSCILAPLFALNADSKARLCRQI